MGANLQGQRFFNINYIGYMPKNILYNDFLNSADAVIGLGTEGWGLPEFHSVAMGKHALLLNCAGYIEWANQDNAVLIDPNEKIKVYDDIFFREGMPYNQGNIFTFSEEDFYTGCEVLISRIKQNRKNVIGLELRNNFTVKNTVDRIFEVMET